MAVWGFGCSFFGFGFRLWLGLGIGDCVGWKAFAEREGHKKERQRELHRNAAEVDGQRGNRMYVVKRSCEEPRYQSEGRSLEGGRPLVYKG